MENGTDRNEHRMSRAKKILMVEDDSLDAEEVIRTLAIKLTDTDSQKYDVRHVSTLTRGLKALDCEQFDLILLDMGLPDASETESFEKIYALTPHIPIVMITGSQDQTLALEMVRSGAQDFLIKGVSTRQELVRCVAYAIERHLLKGELAKTISALHHKSAILQSVIDHMGDGVLVTDQTGAVKILNPAAAELLDSSLKLHTFPDAEASDEMEAEASFDEAFAKKAVDAVLKGKEMNEEEFFITTPQHPEGRYISVTARPVNDQENALHGCVAVLHDITKRRKLEELKDEFVSMVSHELRTPLTSINGSLGLLLADVTGTLSAEAKSFIDIAFRNSDRLVRLIGDLLDIQKLESGKMKIEMNPLNISKLIEQAVDANQGYAEKHGVSILISNNPGEAVFVQGDEDRLLQVMANLLSNAIKFSPEGGIVTVEVVCEDENVIISVKDQGEGIPEAFQKEIFKKFAQAGGEANRKKTGTGLGLNISQSIISLHNGQIWFETTPGKGTAFMFRVPFTKVGLQEETRHTASSDLEHELH